MTITESSIRGAKYPPELVPDSWFGTVPANAEFAPPVLDLRRFKPCIAILTNIQTTQPAGYARVNLRARYDINRVEENVAAMLPLLVSKWNLIAKDILYFNWFNTGAPVADFTTHYGVWAFPPTVAHKLLYDISLDSGEQAICDELGIKNTVEKGILPLPIRSQIEREYPILAEETHSRNVNIAAAATVYTIETIYAKADEIIVLTEVAAAPGTTAQDVRLHIDRDDDVGYAELRAYALSLNQGGAVACFIPAITEIRLTTDATVAPAWHLFRYTFQRIKLTNILRTRFGLITESELTTELRELRKKVLGGIV